MQITTNGQELILVEVPMEAKEIQFSFLGEGYLIGKIEGQNNGNFLIITYVGNTDEMKVLGTLTNGVADFNLEPYVIDGGFSLVAENGRDGLVMH